MIKYKILMENESLVCVRARVCGGGGCGGHGPFGLNASIQVQASTGFTQLENKNRPAHVV